MKELKKVFYINCADHGSTGKIIKETATFINNKGCSSVLCVPRKTGSYGDTIFEKTYTVSVKYEQGIYNRITKFNGNIYGFAPLSTMKIIRALKKENPDLVHLHCVNGHMVNVYKLLDYLKKNKTSTVITNHCEMFYTANCDHAYDCEKWKNGCGGCEHLKDYLRGIKRDNTAKYNAEMKAAFSGFEKLAVVSVSEWVDSRVGQSPITADTYHKTIENGIDTKIFTKRYNENPFKKYGIAADEKIILHVTSLFNVNSIMKGSEYIIKLAERFRDNNVVFVVVGPYIQPENCPTNIKFTGEIRDQEKLAELYSYADLSIITSRRETYGMSVAESLCCGTPIVGFKAGGPETVAIPDYSEFCDYGDMAGLEKIIIKWIVFKEKPDISDKISSEATQRYSNEHMASDYYNLYIDLMKN